MTRNRMVELIIAARNLVYHDAAGYSLEANALMAAAVFNALVQEEREKEASARALRPEYEL